MTEPKDVVLQRLKDLVSEGAFTVWGVSGEAKTPTNAATSKFLACGANMLDRGLGRKSVHYEQFAALVKGKDINVTKMTKGIGLLRAAIEDVEHGYLTRFEDLVHADVLEGFLTQADALAKAGHFQVAAVVGGCALEDALRKMCRDHGIRLSAKPKLDKMNADLAKAGAYDKFVAKRITSIADLRNSGAHGRWDGMKKEDVLDSLAWIRRFIESQIGML